MAGVMAKVNETWCALEPLQNRSDEFLDHVAAFLPQVQALTADQKRAMALFKAAELVNALPVSYTHLTLPTNREV